MSVLSVHNIVKNYGAVKALNDVSFDVPNGSVFGILGPNGSGKTTMLGIVMDVLKATSGTYSWNENQNSAEQRKQIGTLLETPNFYTYLSGQKNLQITAAIKGCDADDIERVLKIVNLYDRRHSAFRTYSLGMKQRLAIAATLLGNPATLVFDEPTNGLDPAGIAEIRELIKQLNREGKTIIMASHILDEVEKVCTHVAILLKGDLKTCGSVKEVLQPALHQNETLILLNAADKNALINAVTKMNGYKRHEVEEDAIKMYCDASVKPDEVNQYCFNNGVALSLLGEKKKNLETRFLEITGALSQPQS
jgi:ABC-2 type transport system ATP-binding protein